MTIAQFPISPRRPAVPGWPAGLDAFTSKSPDIQFRTHQIVIANASMLPADRLRPAVADAYAELFRRAARSGAPHAVRFWNYLPSIHGDLGSGLDRYMIFNAGRLDGLERALGSADALQGRVATASAVGHDGDDLMIHLLSADRPGRPVANPRQVDPVRYSSRYGPRPPCFARATSVTGTRGPTRLFVGGTASIRGEASLHQRQVSNQLDETFINLAAVVTAAAGPIQSPLSRFTDLRVYHPATVSPHPLCAPIATQFPAVRVEFIPADLCRAELLVEIEGLAEV